MEDIRVCKLCGTHNDDGGRLHVLELITNGRVTGYICYACMSQITKSTVEDFI